MPYKALEKVNIFLYRCGSDVISGEAARCENTPFHFLEGTSESLFFYLYPCKRMVK